MKKIALLCGLIAAFAFSLSAQELAGKYEFFEDGGKTAGGSAVFVGHLLELGSDGTARLSADGYQTARDLICTFDMNAARTKVFFQKYSDDGVNMSQPYKEGDLLLTLENRTVKGKKVVWTIFGNYQPAVKVVPKAGGVFFKAAKN